MALDRTLDLLFRAAADLLVYVLVSPCLTYQGIYCESVWIFGTAPRLWSFPRLGLILFYITEALVFLLKHGKTICAMVKALVVFTQKGLMIDGIGRQ